MMKYSFSFNASTMNLSLFNSEKKYQRGSGFHNTVPVGEPLFDILELFDLLKPKKNRAS